MLIAAAAAIGLALGQVLDLLYDRFFTGERISGAIYRCSHCRSRLRPLLALPLAGIIAAGGRCPDCGKTLPLRAVVLPAGSAALFAISYLVFDDFAPALLAGFFAAIFLTLTLTDLDRRLLPNRIVYPGMLLACALSWGWPDTSVVEVFAGGAAAVLLAAVLLALSLPFGKGAFGMGDVKMIVLMGLVLGVPAILPAIFIGTLAAGVVAAFLILTRLRSRKDYIPHGPFLAFGAVVALYWGHSIWDWYTGP